MAKRGPKPKATQTGRSVVFSSRMAPELKAALDEAAEKAGRTLSEEIQRRLRRTFVDDEQVAERFGDRQTYRLLQLIATAIKLVPHSHLSSGPREFWLQDAGLFDITMKLIVRMLETVRPDGDPSGLHVNHDAPSEDVARIREFFVNQLADLMWLEVVKADPDLPLMKGTDWDHRMSLIRSEFPSLGNDTPDTTSIIVERTLRFMREIENREDDTK